MFCSYSSSLDQPGSRHHVCVTKVQGGRALLSRKLQNQDSSVSHPAAGLLEAMQVSRPNALLSLDRAPTQPRSHWQVSLSSARLPALRTAGVAQGVEDGSLRSPAGCGAGLTSPSRGAVAILAPSEGLQGLSSPALGGSTGHEGAWVPGWGRKEDEPSRLRNSCQHLGSHCPSAGEPARVSLGAGPWGAAEQGPCQLLAGGQGAVKMSCPCWHDWLRGVVTG